MYRAINDYVIVKRSYEEKKTESGIILKNSSEDQMMEFDVVATNELTEALAGKTVVAPRYKVFQLNPDSEVKYGAIKVEEILAIKE